MPTKGLRPEGVEVLHEDDALLVLHKPAGMLSVPGRGEDKQDCLSLRVQRCFPEALVVHRLDMATSGLIVMARTPAAQRALGLAFEQRQVHKRYVAVVAGDLPVSDAWQTIDLPICVDWPRRPLRIIDATHGQASVTRWRSVGPGLLSRTTRLELEPITGRSHQLRVHLQAMGHPILGDTLYAPTDVMGMAPRLLLHAQQITLAHPVHGQNMAFDCACPF